MSNNPVLKRPHNIGYQVEYAHSRCQSQQLGREIEVAEHRQGEYQRRRPAAREGPTVIGYDRSSSSRREARGRQAQLEQGSWLRGGGSWLQGGGRWI
jgi:hypothetical protein